MAPRHKKRSSLSGPKVVVIGVGNEFGGDDAAGIAVARLLKLGEIPRSVKVLEHDGDGAALMELWKGAHAVILVDASNSDARAGAIRRFDATTTPLPAHTLRQSSHAFGVPEAIEMGRALKQLPRRLIVYAIEGRNFAAGARMSSPVERTVHTVADQVLSEIRSLG